MSKNEKYMENIQKLLSEKLYGEIVIHVTKGEITRLDVKKSVKIEE